MFDDLGIRITSGAFAPVDPELLERLQYMTPPPPDEQQSLQEARQFESEAREKLQRDGCPPCYPPYVELPLKVVPKQYKAIIGYWKSQPGKDYMVLCAQWEDWRKFRSWQQNFRQSKSTLEQGLRKECSGCSTTLSDNRLQDLFEFEMYHHRVHKVLREQHRKASATVRHIAGATEADLLAFRNNRDYRALRVRKHIQLLGWIKQEQGVANRSQMAQLAGGRLRSSTTSKSKPKHPRSSERRRYIADSSRARPILEQERDTVTLPRTRSGRVSRPPSTWMPI